MKGIIITFDNEQLRKEFIGWFLDGGGEQYFMDALELRDAVPQGKFIETKLTNGMIEVGLKDK